MDETTGTMQEGQQSQQTEPSGIQEKQDEEKTSFTKEEMEAYLRERLKEERAKAEAEEKRKAEMTFSERERELEKREEEITRREQREQIASMFKEKKIPMELFDYVDAASEASINMSVEKLKKISLACAREHLTGHTPGSNYGSRVTADTFSEAFRARIDRPGR